MTTRKIIEDWSDFTSVAADMSQGGPEGPMIFRGQSDESFSLRPSLTRVLKEKNIAQEQGLYMESKALASFKRVAHLAADFCGGLNHEDVLLWWEIMQHYNAPTRLLDWSKSPYVALYFAVEDLSSENGAFYTFDAGHLNFVKEVRYRSSESDWVRNDMLQLGKSLNNEAYEKTIMVVGCPRPTNRMVAQQSSFTVCTELLSDHDVFSNNMVFSGVRGGEGKSIVQKFTIPHELKSVFLQNLEKMNITANTLFPGIDGLGRSIKELIGILSTRVRKKYE